MIITIVAGARPNFIKIAPIINAIVEAQRAGNCIDYRLVHTGQHYDNKMSATFFNDLNIPQPAVNLECGGGTQAEQTAAIMVAFERELLSNPPDIVLVVGDVTSTMACSIVAKKLNIRVAHVEAGIRSFDLTMPEEINRIVTDSICDYFFTTSVTANQNLLNSGISSERIFFVGNVMIDTLMANRERFRRPMIADSLNLVDKQFVVLTMHRPANVDQSEKFRSILELILKEVQGLPIVFPMHPRSSKSFMALDVAVENLHVIEPLGYLEFNYLVANAKAVITDSGGITEETTVLNVPCLTLRNSTERPETCTIGTNELVGDNPEKIKRALALVLTNNWKTGRIPELWDGQSAGRIVNHLISLN